MAGHLTLTIVEKRRRSILPTILTFEMILLLFSMMASSILIFNLFNCNFSLHNLYVDISLFDRESREFNLLQNKEMGWMSRSYWPLWKASRIRASHINKSSWFYTIKIYRFIHCFRETHVCTPFKFANLYLYFMTSECNKK